jgi:hypothetical protein
MSKQTPAKQLFDLLVSRDFDPELLDSSGMPAKNPADAELFSFDFRAESGKDYGTVVIMLGDDNNFEVYFGDNVGRTMEGQDKNDWFAFLHQLKNFAIKNFMSFSPKNINRLRYSMQGQAVINEGLFESWTGTRTQSWNGKQTEARLMIRHKRAISEGDARFRYVESLFVETAEGERYKLPFTKLSGGRAMVEHVRNGGKPYDARGCHIAEIVNELNVLSRFKRANQGKIFEGDTAQLVEQTNAYYETAQKTLKSLSTHRGYSTYFESWDPAEVTEEEMVIEGLKHLFVTQSIDTRIESALPLLAKIQQQGTAMKEANIFEAWADRLVEGTWQTPDTPEKQAQLLELMSTDLPVGADATNVTEQLYDLLGDDQLFDQLQELADRDANADARQIVLDRMQELSNDPDIRRVIEQLNIDATAEMNPAEPTEPVQEGNLEDCDSYGGDAADSLISDVEVNQRKYQTESALKAICRSAGLLTESRLMDSTGETLTHIISRFPHEVRNFEQGGDLDEHLYDALFDYYMNSGDMPYGVAKARTGDPYEWVAQNLESHLRGHGIVGGDPDEDYGMERESVMHGDFAEEAKDPLAKILKIAGVPAQERPAPDYMTSDMEENKEGSTGQIIKKLLDPIAQGLAGGGGKSLSIPLVGEDEMDEETDVTSAGEKIAGMTVGGSLGGIAGGLAGLAAGGLPGAYLGGAAGIATGAGLGNKVAQRAGNKNVANNLNAGANDFKQNTEEGELTKSAQNLGDKIGDVFNAPSDVVGAATSKIWHGDSKHPDIDEEETDEGWKGQLAGGTLGTLAGGAAGSALGPIGAAVGSAAGGTAGQMIGDKLGGSDEEESLLKGKYGHSGKLKEVAKDTSFLDRLKELSGMKK